MKKENIIFFGDAYKYTHWLQDPIGTTKKYAYAESRGSNIDIPYTIYFGLQGFVKKYLVGQVLEQWMIDEAEELLGEVFGTNEYFNKKAFQRLLEKHNGKLPIEIRAVEEGLKIPTNNVLVTIINTDDEFWWLTQWVETMLLRAIWYPTTVATVSYRVKELYAKYAKMCGAAEYHPFILNDFGARGVSSHESAGIGGAAHLVNFLGTDTIEGIKWAKDYYGKGAAGYSVYATEHSTTTIYREQGEENAVEHFLKTCPDNMIISMVIDSYNSENFVRNIMGKKFKEKILNRAGKTVARPDSGNPIEMSLKVIEWLGEAFGYTLNEKGFKVLNPKVGCIYGDGVNLNSIEEILKNLIDNKWSVENIIFGMGGKLLQAGIDRDTFKFAMKCSWAEINGYGVEVYKNPITDTGKKSKRGRLELINDNGIIKTYKEGEWTYGATNMLQLVFRNGELMREMTFEQVRNNAK